MKTRFRLQRLILAGLLLSGTCAMWSQNVTLKFKKAKLENVLSAIKSQTGYSLIFSDQIVNVDRPVSIDVKEIVLEQALTQLLDGTGLSFEVKNNKIYLIEKDQPEKVTANTTQKKITGTVKDVNGEAIIGANVIVKGTSTGSITDINGNFSFDVPTSGTLVVSYIGYVPQDVAISGKSSFTIVLKDDSKALDEVVVVGYGARKKETLTGAISKIDGKDMKVSPSPNLTASLGGKIPGVISVNSSGQPGADSNRILIRGLGTMGNNNPLIIVDGVDVISFDRIDPNDIESLSVLKDASAAIYGAKAANGVIIVTTKRGQTGKPTVEYGYNIGLAQPTKKIEVADAYTYNKYINSYFDNNNESDKKMSDSDLEKLKTGSDPDNYFANTDWWDETIRSVTPIQRHNLSIRGGRDDVKYFLSAGYLTQESVFKNGVDAYDQFNYRSNVDWQVSKYIQIGASLSGRVSDKVEPTSNMRDIWMLITSTNPRYPAFFSNGLPWQGKENGWNPVIMGTDQGGMVKEKSYNLTNMITFKVDVPKVEGLFVDGWYSYDFGFSKNRRQQYPWTVYGRDEKGNYYPVIAQKLAQKTLTEKSSNWASQTFNVKLNYVKKFDKHDFNFFVAYEQSKYRSEWSQAGRVDLITTHPDSQLFMGSSEGQIADGSAYETSRRNFFTRLSYNYNYRYFIDFTFRRDGSPIFPANKRYGNFPSVSGSWRISEETFMANLSAVNNLKLRASWGQLGNDRVDEYQYLTAYNLSAAQSFFGFSNTLASSFYPGVNANPNITWEVAQNANIGLEGDLFDRLLSFEFDVYKNQRKNILITRNASVPDYIGLKLPSENLGKMNNSGFEIVFGHQNKVNDFEYNLSVNFSKNKNEVVDIDETPNALEWQRRTGRPFGSDLYYEADGLYTQADIDNDDLPKYGGAKAGDIKIVNYNNDEVIDGDDRVRLEKYTAVPGLIYGFSIGAGYENFDFSAVFQGAGQIYRSLSFEGFGLSSNYLAEAYTDYWTPENKDARWPRANSNSFATLLNKSTFSLFPAGYLRCSSLSLGYTIPKQILTMAGITGLRVCFSGSNLFTVYNKLKYFDPEVSEGRGAYYPLQRIFNFGATISF